VRWFIELPYHVNTCVVIASIEEWENGTDELDEYVDTWVGMVSHEVERVDV
jgi:hypothetical protein